MQITYHQTIATLQLHDARTPTLDYGFVEQLAQAVDELNANQQLTAVVIVGGEKYFSSGADIKILEATVTRDDALHAFTSYVASIPRLILSMNVPTVAAMVGHAIGGGLAMGLWCDFTFMANESLYGANFMKVGFTPGMGSTAILPQVFGNFLAREMLFSGKLFKGQEIKFANNNLSNYILPANEVAKCAYALAVEISDISSEAVRLLKNFNQLNKLQLLEQAIPLELAMHKKLEMNKKANQFKKMDH